VTDEDIEMILAQAEERTSEFNQKLTKHTGDLLQFTTDDDDAGERPLLVDAIGDNAADQKASDLAFLNKVSEAIGKRDRQRSRKYV
jgi:UDP-glucose 6-dehydrogenase